MASVIKAIVLAALGQVAVLALLIGYMGIHTDNTAKAYAQLVERNAHFYTDESLRNQYNTLQIERRDEREDIRAWVDRRIDLKVSQALKGGRQ
ncbi:hypothetical protein [Pseudomonas fluorescens]|uniref:hypothetical protein n=1 Tax=Pseudomonas fluorescens TaxID=294 RepID=UPI0038175B09